MNTTTNITCCRLRIGIRYVVALFIAISTLAVYQQVSNFKFVSFDDALYVKDNPYVRKGIEVEGIKWAFGFGYKDGAYWHPLTWMSLMLDAQLFGLNPGAFHLTNAMFHVANSMLLFFVLVKATKEKWKSALVAILFALHPLNVESVAWIAERKNVLSTFFWLLTMYFYVIYAQKSSIARYLSTLIAFGVGLLAKPMLITIPFVLLMMDYWPLDRLKILTGNSETQFKKGGMGHSFGILLVEKLPFLALSGLSLWLSTASLRHYDQVVSGDVIPMGLRIENAIVSYWHYVFKMICPEDLAVFYPYPDAISLWMTGAALGFICAASAISILKIKSLPALFFGWFWFLGTLVPVSGIVQAGLWPAMADRWFYVPGIGLFIAVTWGGNALFDRLMARYAEYKRVFLASALFVVFVCVAGLMSKTWLQLKHWQNSLTLFQHTASVTRDNPVAYNNLGVAFADENRVRDAIKAYRKALLIDPDYDEAYNNLGLIFTQQGKLDKSLKTMSKALRLNPLNPKTHNNIGFVLAKEGNFSKAIFHFKKALEIKPNYADAHYNMGLTFMKQGKTHMAVSHYRKALDLNPYDSDVYNNLGVALIRQGKVDEGINCLKRSLQIDPGNRQTQRNIARISD